MEIAGVGSISDVVIAASTVIYTIGTLLLWQTTKRNTDLLSEQIKELSEQSARSTAFNRVLIDNSITDAHREVWSLVLNNSELFELLVAKEAPTGEKVVVAEWLGSIFINHCARIHLAYHEKIFDSEEMDAFARDARSLFAYHLIRWRWKTVAKYHSTEFRQFVDRMIEA